MIDVLMVDDDDADVRLVEELIKDSGLGLRLRSCRDGGEALEALRDGAMPDAILMDINMPGMDGHATVRAMRDEHGDALSPVLMLTTSVAEGDITQSIANDADAYVRKPPTPENILAALSGSRDPALAARAKQTMTG